jgi:hypothetical protein
MQRPFYIAPRAGILEPPFTTGLQRQGEPIRMSVPAAGVPALERDIHASLLASEHRQSL